jgi:DNA (cytosine-5)-methyltransferase 1
MWSLVSNNKQAHSAKRGGHQPAPTITGGHDSGNRMWIDDGEDDVTWGYRDRPAPTVTGGGGKASGIELFDQGTRKKMLAAIEEGSMDGNGRIINPNTPLDPIRVTVEEAAILQSYPPVDLFTWKGAKTKQYMQIRNACPPLLVERVLESLWAIPAAHAEDLELAA